jgi:hypothetical protein
MIENFFIERKYQLVGKLFPTCVYPEGFTEQGIQTIEKITDCGNIFNGYKCSSEITRSTGETYNDSFTYTRDGIIIHTNNLGTARSGCFTVCGKIITSFTEGFSQTLGKFSQRKITYELNDIGYQANMYFLDPQTNQYTLYYQCDLTIVGTF